MMERTTEMSPRLKARITGVCLSPHHADGNIRRFGLAELHVSTNRIPSLLLPYIAVLGLLGAVLLVLWLLVLGVNEQRWKEQASAAGNWRS
jgi:hypothetical protein